MAILSQFLRFPSVFPHSHSHNWQHQLQQSHKPCRVLAFSIKKSRKVKTNEELCDDIREFVAVNGLPEGYVPTMKEFSQLGRSDLAYIVRRRGYRAIGELLESTKETDLLDGSNVEKGVTEDQVGLSASENKYEKPIDSVVVQAIGNSSDSFLMETDDSDLAVETFAELENDLKSLDIGENESGLVATEHLSIENHVNSSVVGQTFDPDDDIDASMRDPINLSIGEEDLDGKNEMVKLSVESANGQHEDENTDLDAFITETSPSSETVGQVLVSNEEDTVSVSLEEKVSNFMRHGHLDSVEESDSRDTLKESGIEEVEIKNSTSAHTESADTNFNGSAPKSMQVVTIRDENLVVEQQSNLLNKGVDDDKTGKRDNNFEVNHLMFLLNEKELELSRLKEQIEKEKRALSLLQAKAETEISKAQKLISEKDAELLAAEEMLSELVEVQIQYHGDGKIVEVAGSFNGWHHWIKMDPNPSSSITNSIESRKSKLWTTVLWLYPGIYEIKFVVDGEWKIDPRLESVSNGAICNNILRVH